MSVIYSKILLYTQCDIFQGSFNSKEKSANKVAAVQLGHTPMAAPTCSFAIQQTLISILHIQKWFIFFEDFIFK